ncbi:WxL protein peptidoglycan domain-containing protein [Bacillus haynesii]|uniref:WxL protein peptidoglycan domain-containing protein n=1 Tax=Bacillus haynesii TaxID=1925021 RepID=UPI0023D94694|nr:DUF916 domain-containing protein [Bacillus haynesii]
MLKKISFTFTTMLILAIAVSLGSIKTWASELNFSVETVIPENQINKKLTYFDLLMEPSKKQTLEIVLR